MRTDQGKLTHHSKHQKHDSDERTCPKAVVLPYIAGVTERIECVCCPLEVE